MARLTALHGFTQTTGSFDPLRTAAAPFGIVLDTPELPGHGTGQGPGRLVTGDLWTGAADLADRWPPGVWLGYSMGARLALHVAIGHPRAVTGLVLIGGTAGIDAPDERAARRSRDEALADRIETVGVPAFLDEWLALDLFATLPDDPQRLTRRATNTATGLASSLRRWGTGTMDPPLWDRLGSITVPTLILAGDRDSKFTGLGRRLATGIGPNAVFTPVPDAGHAAHIERPAACARIIAEWSKGIGAQA